MRGADMQTLMERALPGVGSPLQRLYLPGRGNLSRALTPSRAHADPRPEDQGVLWRDGGALAFGTWRLPPLFQRRPGRPLCGSGRDGVVLRHQATSSRMPCAPSAPSSLPIGSRQSCTCAAIRWVAPVLAPQVPSLSPTPAPVPSDPLVVATAPRLLGTPTGVAPHCRQDAAQHSA
jgi:hypothetical protein